MAERSGLSPSTIGRIWRQFELKPHRTDGFKLSNDPLFVDKVDDVVGLYQNPPEGAVVYCVDEKSPGAGVGPLPTGLADDARHAREPHATTTSAMASPDLFAAFNIADGTVISSCTRVTAASSSRSS